MIDSSLKKPQQSGRILIIVLIFMLTLSAFWFIALSSTGAEMQLVGGRKTATQQFFDAEAGLAAAMESAGDWMTDAFLSEDPATAQITPPTISDPESGKAVATITCRPVQADNPGAAVARKLPVQAHVGPPPPGYGSRFAVKRYAINSVSATGGKEIQAGVEILINKN